MKKIITFLVATLIHEFAVAEICDYTPSNLFGAAASGSLVTGAGAIAGAGTGMKAAGFYAFQHAITGAYMLGSTAGGASAAGTVGIMGGTAGAVGTVSAALMSPFFIVPAAIAAVSIAGYEGACFFADEDGHRASPTH